LLLDRDWPEDIALRTLLTGGDRLLRNPPTGLPFDVVNNYGPTEAAVVATSGALSPGSSGPPHIGRQIQNVHTHLLDDRLEPVPFGVPGELYIGGRSLARGYLKRAGLTAERFLPDPFSPVPGGRMYATGDRVRFGPDGVMEFLGRVDFQVKVRASASG
jgi:non-ribosomal peptide synthetase component F